MCRSGTKQERVSVRAGERPKEERGGQANYEACCRNGLQISNRGGGKGVE
jgi:hypothetical protein